MRKRGTGRSRRLVRELQLIRTAFRNWPVVAIAGLLWRHLPLPRHDLVLVTRDRTRFVVPLGRKAGALYPALEVFAFSTYAHDWRLEQSPFIIDIGAHVGAFTLWLAEKYASLRVTCFEPDPDAFRYLERNLRGLDVVMRREAVAGRSGTSALTRPIPGGAVSALRDSNGQPGSNVVDVRVVAFDEVMAGIHDPVALVKLDCEGSEYDIVLQSAANSWRQVHRVVIEYHPMPAEDPRELVERLSSIGFALTREHSVGGDVGTYWLSRA